MSKSEGQKVREAFDGPKVKHDDLIAQLDARIREETARSSDASESAAKIAKFIEATGLNTQALSWAKTILKKLPKKDGEMKAMDVIRSLEAMLPMLKNHVGGQQSEMSLDGPKAKQADTSVDQKEGEGEGADDAADADAPVPEGDPDIAEEAADFAQAATAVGDNTVTPIDFGGAR